MNTNRIIGTLTLTGLLLIIIPLASYSWRLGMGVTGAFLLLFAYGVATVDADEPKDKP